MHSLTGSSPLARGLPRGRPPRGGPRRIIPARAGFTPSSGTSPRSRWDHPRSRGVYQTNFFGTRFHYGSSPLARGLLTHPPRASTLVRIIPARAGFTCRSCFTANGWRDHPRSRGVYRRFLFHATWADGSSPLARGLPPAGCRPLRSGRIIPARAGFTFISVPLGWSVVGSSPLARGLPTDALPPARYRGIIPARAGFTYYHYHLSISKTDHPRSRGVYGPLAHNGAPGRGSSPLARGLQPKGQPQ